MPPLSILLFLIIAVASAVCTFFFCRSRFRSSVDTQVRYDALLLQHRQLQIEERILHGLFGDAQTNRDAADARAVSLQAQVVICSNQLSSEIARREAVQQKSEELSVQLSQATAALEQMREAQTAALTHAAGLQAQLDSKEAMLQAQKEFIETTKGDMEREFRSVASAMLDQSGARLSEQQQEKLVDTLAPFRNDLDAFRRQVDEKFGQEADGRNTLKGELHKMLELNQTISRQTENLTTALTKQSKQQGGYGEDVLETILTNAGMMEGEHYYRQWSTRNEDGARIQPDIIVKRPNGLSIVVDSKVSLTHYVRYCDSALAPQEEKALRKELYLSFKAHIDSLSGKKYDTIEGTADFILMFTPAENAFTIAANHDAALRQYAFGKNVFVVTPSSLLLVIKMISDLWQKDRLNKEAHAIAARAKELYEKACGFMDSFAGVGQALDKAKGDWDRAATRLSGNGGLVRQGEMLQKLLGSKTAKTLPEDLVARAALVTDLHLPDHDMIAEGV